MEGASRFLGVGGWIRMGTLGIRMVGFRTEGLGCSSFYEKSLIGARVHPIIIPIKDCEYEGEHPNLGCIFSMRVDSGSRVTLGLG